jgi:hypothetical protein
MSYEWTREEIRMTRRAWRLRDRYQQARRYDMLLAAAWWLNGVIVVAIMVMVLV